MCLEVNSIHITALPCFLIEVHVVCVCSVEESSKKDVIQNGWQNEVTVITYVMVPIATDYKENKTCHGGIEEAWQKSIVASQPWNEYWRIFHTADDNRQT